MCLASLGIEASERGLVPDAMTRWAIRRLCQRRLDDLTDSLRQRTNPSIAALQQSLRHGPIALETDAANRQHYELPPKFFELVLGARRKYSCCYFEGAHSTLEDAENAALEITCQRAQIVDGQSILDLGCGWGALSLWMAERYRSSHIVAVSNSASQRTYIESLAGARGLTNLQVLTADINDFCPSRMTFDRVVSVEMFEHLRNYQLLLQRISDWLKPGGSLFVHVFCNRRHTYAFETNGSSNWMGRHFFTGGIMPAAGLLTQFSDRLTITEQFSWNGDHYRRTAEGWLANLDLRQREILSVLKSTYGKADARRWLNRWRIFFLAVAELFAFGGGNEWYVSHYLLRHAVAHKPITSADSERSSLSK
jgi:cyclopropane-fatty-acyl-phospholipid synthase